ncbi:MAG: O-methyltransferase [Gemmatimonadota bacterium]
MDPHIFEACLEYTRELFAPEDSLLRSIREEIGARDWPAIHVSPEEGKVLQVLVRAAGARRAVEIGTLAGYSAVWLARGLRPEGRLVTIEKESEYAAYAREVMRRGGLDGVVEVREGVARRVLERIAGDGPYDVLFIDADKRGYPAYLEWGLRNVRRGGLILADNAYWQGAVADPAVDDADTRGVREYNRRVAEDPRLASVILPVRDGLAVSVVVG